MSELRGLAGDIQRPLAVSTSGAVSQCNNYPGDGGT